MILSFLRKIAIFMAKFSNRWRTLLKFLLSVVIFYFLFEEVLKKITIQEVLTSISLVDRNLLLFFCLNSLIGALILALRYKVMMQIKGLEVSLVNCFLIGLVRNFFVDLIPARIGSLVQIYLFPRYLGADYSFAVSAFAHMILLEIFCVGMLIFIISGFSLLVYNLAPSFIVAVIIAGVSLLAYILIFRLPKFVNWAERRVNSMFLKKCSADFEALSSRGSALTNLLALTFLQRLYKYISYWLLLLALVKSFGFSESNFPFLKVIYAFFFAELAVSLPVFTVGGVGAFQSGWVLMFHQLGFTEENFGNIIAITSFSHHIITQVWGLILGIMGVVLLFLIGHKFFLKNVTLNKFTWGASALWPGLALLAPSFKVEVLKAPSIEISFPSQICSNCSLLFDSFDGQQGVIFLFTSNEQRKISYGKVNQFPFIDTKEQVVWTTTSPAISKYVGGKIAKFNLKSQNWEIITEGTFPWLANSGVIFEKDRRKVVLLSESGEKTLYQSERGEIAKPSISMDGKLLAFTSSEPSRWSVKVVDLMKQEELFVSKGCQINFGDGNSLSYVRILESKETEIVVLDQSFKAKKIISDVLGRKKLYFPFVFRDWILLGASRNLEDTPEKGNFDIFAVNLVTEEVLQITNSNLLNRFPRLFKNQS